jgi:hypothetical protein
MNKQNKSFDKLLDRLRVKFVRKHTVERFTKALINDKLKYEKP